MPGMCGGGMTSGRAGGRSGLAGSMADTVHNLRYSSETPKHQCCVRLLQPVPFNPTLPLFCTVSD